MSIQETDPAERRVLFSSHFTYDHQPATEGTEGASQRHFSTLWSCARPEVLKVGPWVAASGPLGAEKCELWAPQTDLLSQRLCFPPGTPVPANI